jgi:membrane-associated phospholipid phosphatase
MSAWLEWGIPIIVALQSLGDWLLTPMRVLSLLGTEWFFLLVMPAVVWSVDATLGLRMGCVLLSSAILNSILKVAFGWPRPYWLTDRVRALAFESTYGMPSGHAQNALAMWGALAITLRRRATTIGLALVILGISVSRLYLGVHFPSDILGGWLVAGAWLLLVVLLEAPVERWVVRQRLAIQLLIPTMASLVLLGVGLQVYDLIADRPLPVDWIARASGAFPDLPPIDPQDVADVVSPSGTLLGLGIGAVLLHRNGRFRADGSATARVARFTLGIAGIAVIFFGLRAILPSGDTPWASFLSYLRYASVGLWVAYLAPWLFLRLRLA